MRHDGTSLTVAIEDDLKTSLSNGNINMTCSKGVFSMPVAECDKWIFSNNNGDDDVWSGVESISASDVLLIHKTNRMVLRGVKEGEIIMVTAINGIVIASGQAVANTDFVIDLTDVVAGVYIVSYGNHSVKVTIR